MSDRKVRRRQFLQASATAAAGFVIVKPGSVYGSPANDAVTLGIIGCGGRGNYVGKEMVGAGAQVVALHDLFDDRLAETRERFDKLAEEKGQPKIADGMIFKGPDAYRKLLASGIDAVLITSPPYFHPDHFEAAVDAKRHCYLEKPVASDVYGARRVEAAGRKGAGKVSMAVGFQSHYAEPYQEMGSLEFSSMLVREARVATSPGVGFGPGGDGFVRFALIENEQRIGQAVRNLRRALTKL